jgi:GTP-binding protein
LRIDHVEFETSATEPDQYPWPDRPEVAFGGRSNVGKSSLINTLVNRKNLVRTSKEPGRTRTLNFYDLNGELYLVDLPGYGYAKVSKEERYGWGEMIETYLDVRRNLEVVVCVLDLRRGIEEDDQQLIEAAPHFGVQPIPVFTKADKVGSSERQQRLREIASRYGGDPEEFVLLSGEDRRGPRDLWSRIEDYTGIIDS